MEYLIVVTQYFENYNCDNPGEGDDTWKPKGSVTYQIPIPSSVIRVPNMIVDFYEFVADNNNPMSREYPKGWDIVDEIDIHEHHPDAHFEYDINTKEFKKIRG